MNPPAQTWLGNLAALPGVLACGVRAPDGQLACETRDEGYQASRVEKLLAHYESLSTALFSDVFAPRWSTWTYDQGKIRFVPRPDGWVLAVVLRSDSTTLPRLDALSQEFLSLEIDR